MTEKELLQSALELGFANAAIVDTEDIIFEPAFRPLCAENLCGKYGANYTCPPACGTVEEMRRRVLGYRRAIVLQTMWDIDDPLDEKQTKPAKGTHNRLPRQLIDRAGEQGLMIGASGCSLCSPCMMPQGKPCRFPDLCYSCMSAYCIFVRELAQRCGMEYECSGGIVTFFSMYCFQKRLRGEANCS